MILNTLIALGSVLLVSAFNVLLSYLLIFRTPTYQSLNESLIKNRKKLEEIEEKEEDNEKTAKKKKRVQETIDSATKRIQILSMRYYFISYGLLFIMNRMIRSQFNGKIMARIPFEPFGLIASITHNGIENEDKQDANFQFIYWLGTTLFKEVLNRWFGFQMPQLNMGTMTQMAN